MCSSVDETRTPEPLSVKLHAGNPGAVALPVATSAIGSPRRPVTVPARSTLPEQCAAYVPLASVAVWVEIVNVNVGHEVGTASACAPTVDSVLVVAATHMPTSEGVAFAPGCGDEDVADGISEGTSTFRLWSTPQAVASAAATTNAH